MEFDDMVCLRREGWVLILHSLHEMSAVDPAAATSVVSLQYGQRDRRRMMTHKKLSPANTISVSHWVSRSWCLPVSTASLYEFPVLGSRSVPGSGAKI